MKRTYLGQLVYQKNPTSLGFCYWLHDPWDGRLPELLHKQAVVLQHHNLSDSLFRKPCTSSAPLFGIFAFIGRGDSTPEEVCM